MLTVLLSNVQVENIQTQTGKVFQKVTGAMDNGQPLQMSCWDNNVHQVAGQNVQFSYTQKVVGANTYLNIKSWEVMPGGGGNAAAPAQAQAAQPQQTAVSTPLPASNATVDRQESIERQSALKAGIEFVGYLAANAGGTAKEKAAAKDPEVMYAMVVLYAAQFKDFVQNGNWDMQATEGDADIPF